MKEVLTTNEINSLLSALSDLEVEPEDKKPIKNNSNKQNKVLNQVEIDRIIKGYEIGYLKGLQQNENNFIFCPYCGKKLK